ncbi:MAG: dTMP kinase [Clostridia bacterium]
MRGFFISIEGLDGSGKTTQIEAIKKHLENKGLDVIFLREPGGTEIGEKIRHILLDAGNKEMDPVAEMLLYAASRAQMVAQKVLPLLEANKTVVCDRYIDSSIAFQGYGRELDIEQVRQVNMIAVRNLLPDLTLFIDVEPETSIGRRKSVSLTDRLENEPLEFHKKVYRGYQELCSRYPGRMVPVDGRLSSEEITAIAIGHINHLIEKE